MTGRRFCTIAWTKINPHVDVAGLEQGGYKLVFKDKPSKSERMMQMRKDGAVEEWIAGTRLGCGSARMEMIADVLWNGPADKAGLAPGEKIMAVNDKVFSGDALREAFREAKDPAEGDQGDRAGGFVCIDDAD